MKYTILLSLFLIGCGLNGTQKFDVSDSTQNVVQSGSSFTYVTIRLEFIQQVNDLCKASLLESDYASEELYNKAVAECTFKNLAILNINPAQVTDFTSQYCQPGADLSSFTPDQIAQIQSACNLVH